MNNFLRLLQFNVSGRVSRYSQLTYDNQTNTG